MAKTVAKTTVKAVEKEAVKAVATMDAKAVEKKVEKKEIEQKTFIDCRDEYFSVSGNKLTIYEYKGEVRKSEPDMKKFKTYEFKERMFSIREDGRLTNFFQLFFLKNGQIVLVKKPSEVK